MMSVWKYEMTRINLLADVIADKKLSGDLQVDWNPDIRDIWPKSDRSWGLDMGFALNIALEARSNESISLVSKNMQRISWISDEGRWSFAPAMAEVAAGDRLACTTAAKGGRIWGIIGYRSQAQRIRAIRRHVRQSVVGSDFAGGYQRATSY